MGSVARQGRTILFVSHNMRAITDLCQTSLWIDGGKIVQRGDTRKVVLAYLEARQSRRFDGIISDEMHLNATGEILFRCVRLLDATGESKRTVFFGESLRIFIEFEVCRTIEDVRIAVAIEQLGGTMVSVFHNTDQPHGELFSGRPGDYCIELYASLALMPGGYSIHLAAKPAPGSWGTQSPSWDWVQRALDFHVEEFNAEGQAVLPTGGVVRPQARWTIERVRTRVETGVIDK